VPLKTANSAAFDGKAQSQLGESRASFLGSRCAVSFAEIREAQCGTQHSPAAAQSGAGDPGIESSTHEGRQLTWLLQNGSEHGADVGRAIGTQPDQRSRRKRSICRINDNASGSKGNLTSGSDRGGDVRLHINRNRARLRVQQLLSLGIGGRTVHSKSLGVHSLGKPVTQGSCPRLVGRKTLPSGYDRGRNYPIANGQPGRQSAGDSKADNPERTALNRGLKSSGETLALAADDGHARASGDARLQRK
jgi:hypothetical protein